MLYAILPECLYLLLREMLLVAVRQVTSFLLLRCAGFPLFSANGYSRLTFQVCDRILVDHLKHGVLGAIHQIIDHRPSLATCRALISCGHHQVMVIKGAGLAVDQVVLLLHVFHDLLGQLLL